MKTNCIIIIFLTFISSYSQEHFSGISFSNRAGIINANVNPAALSNLYYNSEFNLAGFSLNLANNKISFRDIINNNNFENIIFKGNKNVDLTIDGEILGPAFAIKWEQWSFGIQSKAYIKANLIGINPTIGDAISNNGTNNAISTFILNSDNQRANATTYGELGFSIARIIYENDKYKWSGGTTVKLLFPGSYANFGLQTFEGTITQSGGNSFLNNATGSLNIAYTDNLGSNFTATSDYTKSVFGKLNGFAFDLGVSFQIKDTDDSYQFNSGIAIRNMGSMTYKDNGGNNTNYSLTIQSTAENPMGLDLSLFDNIESLREIQNILEDSGYLTTTSSQTNFKTKLPSILSFYADVKIIPKLYCTLYYQQKLTDNLGNDQITGQNSISITPRFSTNSFEIFTPVSNNEISGFNTGIGFRIGGFYLGSGSAITALAKNTKQADFYFGMRFGFGK